MPQHSTPSDGLCKIKSKIGTLRIVVPTNFLAQLSTRLTLCQHRIQPRLGLLFVNLRLGICQRFVNRLGLLSSCSDGISAFFCAHHSICKPIA